MRDGRRWQTVLENVLANYAYVGLMAAVTIFLTPLYVRTLGPTEWGVVALCLTVQAVLFCWTRVWGKWPLVSLPR